MGGKGNVQVVGGQHRYFYSEIQFCVRKFNNPYTICAIDL